MIVNLKIFKFSTDYIVGIFTEFNKGAVCVIMILPMYFRQYSFVKFIERCVLEVHKIT